ncbi:MAG: L,D-transpeptidase [Betaproteobacteria bacterium]|nr:L,D-transpeptidase [Betaproteobacteria bacterium]
MNIASVRIVLPTQHLEAMDKDGAIARVYPVSTACKGAGEKLGSLQTPRGRHIVRAKIGAGLPLYSVFSARRPTGEIWTPELDAANPERDWILTRILWLSGREPGFNRLGDVDTMRRYIYIHGCSDFAVMGEPRSNGCIRMRNHDIMELFEAAPDYCPVEIVA